MGRIEMKQNDRMNEWFVTEVYILFILDIRKYKTKKNIKLFGVYT